MTGVQTCALPIFGGEVVPRGAEIGYVILLGVVFTALSGLCFVWLLRKVTTQAISTLGYLEPVSAALLAWAILGQELGWAVLVGGTLIIGAGLLVILYEPAETPHLEAPRRRPRLFNRRPLDRSVQTNARAKPARPDGRRRKRRLSACPGVGSFRGSGDRGRRPGGHESRS